MSRKPRAAGRAFEQSVARDLRAWLGEGWVVKRNQTDRQRGGQGLTPGEFTVARDKGDAGRLADGPERFPFAIECKTNLAFTALHLWSPTALLVGWWEQATEQAGSDYVPLLVCTGRNKAAQREPVLAVMEPKTRSYMGLQGIPTHELRINGSRLVAVEWFAFMAAPVSRLAEVRP